MAPGRRVRAEMFQGFDIRGYECAASVLQVVGRRVGKGLIVVKGIGAGCVGRGREGGRRILRYCTIGENWRGRGVDE